MAHLFQVGQKEDISLNEAIKLYLEASKNELLC